MIESDITLLAALGGFLVLVLTCWVLTMATYREQLRRYGIVKLLTRSHLIGAIVFLGFLIPICALERFPESFRSMKSAPPLLALFFVLFYLLCCSFIACLLAERQRR
jgi:hypothetical protein